MNSIIKPLAERSDELEKEFETIVLARFLSVVKKKMDFDSWKKMQEMVEAGSSSDDVRKFLESRVEKYQDLLQNVISEVEKELKI
jgi:hypothetical protein